VDKPYLEPFYEKLLTGGLSAISWQEGALVLLFELIYRSWFILTFVKGWQALKNLELSALEGALAVRLGCAGESPVNRRQPIHRQGSTRLKRHAFAPPDFRTPRRLRAYCH
jgi:hypothetical protein